MKYIEIDLNRAVELFRQEESNKVFRQCDNGELERVTSLQETFKKFVIYSRYFEQIREANDE
jgi:hypothetical protein